MAQKVRTSQAKNGSGGRIYRVWPSALMMIIIYIFLFKQSTTSKSVGGASGRLSSYGEGDTG